jgi:hypothetical protein
MTSPSEWLLEQYDAAARQWGYTATNHVRPMFEILDDHPGECTGERFCWRSSGVAGWPEPSSCDDLDRSA